MDTLRNRNREGTLKVEAVGGARVVTSGAASPGKDSHSSLSGPRSDVLQYLAGGKHHAQSRS
jgi:hypothetical protein